MAIDRVMLFASNPAAVARLAQPIARAGMTVDAWSYHGSRLAYSRYVREHHELARDTRARARQLTEVAGTVADRDWVILGTDHDLYEISSLLEEGAPVHRLLPVVRHADALRDKAAMATALDQIRVGQPAWKVAETADEVPSAVTDVGGRAMLKTARGWGGHGVTPVDDVREMPAIPGDGPYVIQAWVDGEAMSVDLVTVDGQVAMAPYSEIEVLASPYGISCARRYLPLDDEGLWADLDRLAEGLGGTWLANITVIRRPNGTHAIVEVDVRPNAWHAYLARLGFPMADVLAAIRSGAQAPLHAESRTPSESVVNVSRTLTSVLRGNPGHARQLLRPRAAWKLVNRGDAGLTLRELRNLARDVVKDRG